MRCRKTASRSGSLTSTLLTMAPASAAVAMMLGSSVRASRAVTVDDAVDDTGALDAAERGERSRGLRQRAGRRERHAVELADERDELAAGALGEDAARVDDADAVAEPLGLLHVVRRVEDGHAALSKLVHGFEDGVAALRIDAHGGLVEDEQLRLVEQADADVEAPLHAARVGVRAVVGSLRQAGQLEDGRDALLERLAAETLQPAEEAQVLSRSQVRVDGQVLGHVADERLGLGGVDRPWACPRPSTLPPSRSRSPQTIEMLVVLPAPLGPSRP